MPVSSEVKRPVRSLKLVFMGGLLPVWRGRDQEAQQESFETSVVKDWAAILIPSAMVRYGLHRFATCSTVIPASRM